MGVPWKSSQQQNKRGQNDFSGGINVGQNAFSLKENETTNEYGWDFDEYPALKTRKGRTTYGASGAAVTYLLVNYKNTRLIRAVGTKIQYDNSGTWTDLATGLTATDWDSVNYRDQLILTNGTDNVKTYNGTTLTDLNAVNAPKGKYVTQHDNRVYILKDRTISFSALGIPTDWTTVGDAGAINMSTPGGELGVGMTSYKNHVIAFSDNYYCELYGTGPDDYQLVDGSNGIGCCSFKTIQQVGDNLFWMDQRGVYLYQGGFPNKISQPIQSYIDTLNTAQLTKCWGGTDGQKYYLALVTGTNTEPNLLFVFDPRNGRNKWRIQSEITDLRYSAILNNQWYNGGSSGITYTMNSGETDDGTAIPWSVTSRPFDDEFPEAEKELSEMHLQGLFVTGATLTVEVAPDDIGSTWYTINYDPITASNATQNRNLIVPLDMVPLCSSYMYRLSGTGRVEIIRVQRYSRIQPVQN